MKSRFLLLPAFIFCLLFLRPALGFGQLVTIPDANFRSFLEQNYPSCMVGTVGSKQLDTLCAQSINLVDCHNRNIQNLDGIQYFVNLTNLVCNSNNLTVLDLSSNSQLAYLECSANQLTTLNVSENLLLSELYCSNNMLTSLELPANSPLYRLFCNNNLLTSFILPTSDLLDVLNVSNNQLVNLNCSAGSAISDIDCSNNLLTNLDVSQNLNLTEFLCSYNKLTGLDMSLNSNLWYINCDNNNIAFLNLSNKPILQFVHCTNNPLQSLDLSNNPMLETVNCYQNQLVALYLTNCPTLNYLDCSLNQLTSLNVSDNTALNYLYCQNNQLSVLDVSLNTALSYLDCAANQITHFSGTLPNSLCVLNANQNLLFCLPNIPSCPTFHADIAIDSLGDYIVCGQCTPPIINQTVTNASIFGGNNGSIDLTVTGGSAPYSYLWSNGATTEDLTGLPAGVYTVVVTEANGCSASGFYSVTEPSPLVIAASPANPNIIAGATTTITATGGVSYLWTPGNLTGATIFVKPATSKTYTVVGTGANGATGSAIVTITVTPLVSIMAPITDQSIAEGNSGTQAIPLTVNLAGATNFPVIINLTPSGTAIYGNSAGSDWFFTGTGVTINGAGATITFNANGSKSINWIVFGDADLELNETAAVTLTTQTAGVFIGSINTRTLTINNDDALAASVLGFAPATPSVSTAEGNSGTKLVRLQVTLSGANRFPVVAQIDYAGSTALFGNTFGKDFHLTGLNASNQLIFTANGTKSFNVVVMGDVIVEPNELVNLNLTSPTAGVMLSSANRTVTITNDDAPRMGEETAESQTVLTVYPNPTNDLLNITFNAAEGQARLSLFDLTGRTVWQKTAALIEGTNYFVTSLAEIPSGLYTLEIVDANGRATTKIVKE